MRRILVAELSQKPEGFTREDEKLYIGVSELWEWGEENSYGCELILSSSIFLYSEERLIFRALAVNSLLY